MSHLEEGLLHALLDGEIPSAELSPIQAHLASCASCRARFEEERQLLTDAEAMVGILEVPLEDPGTVRRLVPASRGGTWGRGLAWAASLIGAIGLGYALRGSGPLPQEKKIVAAAPAVDSSPSQALDAAKPAPPPVPVNRNPPQQPHPDSRAGMDPERRRTAIASRGAGALALRPPAESAAAEPKASRELAATGAADSNRNLPRQQPAPAAPSASPDPRLNRLGSQPLRLEEVIVAGAAERNAARTADTPAEPIGLTDALRRLGGSIRLLDGWIPLRLEAQGPYVRVVYPVAQGELVLSQQLIDGRVAFTLIAPPGFPRDSLARLRARVRE